MKRFRNAVFLMLLAASSVYSLTAQQRPYRETWYERALRGINPDNTDYGALLEERKRALIEQLGNRYVLYSFGATAGLVVLMIVMFVQDVSHRRALEIAVRSNAETRRHDERARRAAREAIRRYNVHIETCDRVIEAGESGLWQWTSSAELAEMKSGMQRAADELAAARFKIKSLEDTLQEKSSVVAEMSLRVKGEPPACADPSKHSIPPPYMERINQLELELHEEKKKNLRVKGTGLDVHNS